MYANLFEFLKRYPHHCNVANIFYIENYVIRSHMLCILLSAEELDFGYYHLIISSLIVNLKAFRCNLGLANYPHNFLYFGGRYSVENAAIPDL